MNTELADALIGVLVARMDSVVTGGPLVEWATSALVDGLDTPALVWLAGLPPTCSVFEAGPLLDRALAELGLASLPAAEALRRAYVGVISRQLLDGRLTPTDAVQLIHRVAVGPLNHPADLMPWCYVWEGLDFLDYRVLSDAEAADRARDLARVWASSRTWPTQVADAVGGGA
jgi:hypothetical protein